MFRSPFGRILNRPPVIRLMSRYHVTNGSGFPVTLQVISTERPSATLIDGGGGTKIVGASSVIQVNINHSNSNGFISHIIVEMVFIWN